MRVARDGDVTVVSVAGEVDIATVEAVRDVLEPIRGAVVLDLGGVTFLDTSGLRLVVERDRRSRADGDPFSILPGPDDVQRLFDIAGLRERLPFRARPEVSADVPDRSAGG